jgi:putative flippase GtrA
MAPDPTLQLLGTPTGTGTVPPVVDVVVPVHNEERDVAPSVRRLHRYLSDGFPFSFRITIADNASTDRTLEIARALGEELPEVEVAHLDQKGRGRALKEVWGASDATVLAYLDVDLSTDLDALLPLVSPLVSGHSDIAIGSRLSPMSRVVRGPKREFISRSYNLILRTTLHAGFSDAQCGFKAIRADRARALLPMVEDTGWFFDTELLVLAERAGLRIHEVPVDWVDDPDSRVDIVSTAVADLKGVWRLGRALSSGRLPLSALREQAEAEAAVHAPPGLVGQMVRFGTVGVLSTIAYVVLFVWLRQAMPAQVANLVALLVTALVNTAANARITFGLRDDERGWRHHARGLGVVAIALGLTSGSLAALQALAPTAGVAAETLVLIVANAVATVARFLLYRSWVFPRSGGAPPPTAPLAADRDDVLEEVSR